MLKINPTIIITYKKTNTINVWKRRWRKKYIQSQTDWINDINSIVNSKHHQAA